LIRHAFSWSPTFAVIPLTIAVVVLTIRSLLILAIGFTTLLPAGFLAATITAIALATITTATDVKNGPTAVGNAEPLAKNNLDMPSGVPSHPHPIARWTSGPPS